MGDRPSPVRASSARRPLPMHQAVRFSHLRAVERNGNDDLGRLRSITPPPDVSGTAISSLAAVVLIPLVTAVVARILHPLTFAPGVLVPVLIVPAATTVVLVRLRGLGTTAGLALAVAAAATTFFYLLLVSAVLAVVRALGAGG